MPYRKDSTDGVALVQKDFDNTTKRQQWKITETSRGLYKIKAKSSEDYTTDFCMAAGDGILTSNGRNVEQRVYSNNTDLKDEWVLQPYSVVFYGITNSGHDHISTLKSIQTTMLNGNWTDVTVRSGAISASQCKNDLLSTNVFTSRSHGKLVLWAGTVVAASTGIVLNDKDDADEVVFYSHSWNGMTSGSGNIASGEDYSNIDIALFVGCQTAYGGNGGRNLPTAIVNQGAKASVGFIKSINCDDANKWTKLFYSAMLAGKTLEEAVNEACENFPANSAMRSAVICGDKTITIHQ